MPRAAVDGADLYYEVRGTGPAVLLIMGATGDGGHFDRLADLLADEFTVITYDRRGNGRSPAPAEWTTTSPEEQADDAAALLDALGVGPAAVFGTSSGGNFALYLLIRRPEAIRGAILHEPGLYGVLDDFDAVRAPVRAVIAGAMHAGGPSVAVEAFWNYIAGDNAWDQLPAELRKRLRATAATLFSIELGTYELSLPDNEMLATIRRPIRLLVSEQSLPFLNEIANRLTTRFGWDVARTRSRPLSARDLGSEEADWWIPGGYHSSSGLPAAAVNDLEGGSHRWVSHRRVRVLAPMKSFPSADEA